MSIYKSAIEKPVTTALIFVAVIVIGIYSFLKLPIDQFPEMDPPYITVMTTYPGAQRDEDHGERPDLRRSPQTHHFAVQG